MNQSMEELVKKAIAGDQIAISDLYDKTANRAYYLALELVKDEDMAEDILQDSYVKAFGSLNTLSDPSKFQSWFNTIVVNTSKNYLKKKTPILFSQMATTDDEGEEQEIDFVDESEEFSPEATVDYSETKRLIQEMIDNLPDEQRTAIILRYMEDYSVQQIADIMECSEGTVKSRLNRGRDKIEKDVLDLEKKGTKLYCAPLAGFLLWMFHTTDTYAATAGFGAAVESVATVADTADVTEAPERQVKEAVSESAIAETETATKGAILSDAVTDATFSEGAYKGDVASTTTSSAMGGSLAGAETASSTATSTATATAAEAATGAAVKAGAGIIRKTTIAKIAAAVVAVCVVGGGVAAGVYFNSTSYKWQNYYKSGEQAIIAEEYETAVDKFSRAIEIDPYNTLAYIGRAQAYIFTGETTENLSSAMSDYEKVFELDEWNPEAELGIADIYIRQSDYDTALNILEEALDNIGENEAIENKIQEFRTGSVKDSSGNLRREVNRDADGNMIYYHEFTYNPDGRQASVTSYDSEGNQTGHVDLVYNEDGKNLVSYEWGTYDGVINKTEWIYDDDSTIEIRYSGDSVSRANVIKYNDNGKILEVTDYHKRDDWELEQTRIYEYDEKGYQLTRRDYDSNGELIDKYDDERDSDGKLLKRTEFEKDGAVRRVEVYVYDDEGNYLGENEYDGDGNLTRTFFYE